MLDPHRKIQALIDSFVAELGEVAKHIALEQLKTAFGSAKLAPLRPRAAPSASTYAAAPAAGRPSRSRRGQREIEALRGKLLAVIGDNPGCRAEDINSALGTRTPQIAQPLRRLVADRLVRTEGVRRGTRYFAVNASDGPNGRRPGSDAGNTAEESSG